MCLKRKTRAIICGKLIIMFKEEEIFPTEFERNIHLVHRPDRMKFYYRDCDGNLVMIKELKYYINNK